MVNLKLMFRIIILVAVVLSILTITGCGSTPTLITKEIKVPYETTIHDTIILRDTVINQDTLWSGEVIDSLNNEIGWLRIYLGKKIAELNLKKKDTLLVRDTILVPNNKNNLIPIVASALTWWEQVILYGGIGAILSLLIAMRIKRGKL